HIADGARKGGLPADRVIHVDEVDDAAWHAGRAARKGDWVLVKASRGMKLERAVAALEGALRGADPNSTHAGRA
ncbi:MAG TPA: hypothetical protein VHL80_16610, partial [Polyangia bacterium]|nr:hypothetical protein [Polyangia bacterium]